MKHTTGPWEVKHLPNGTVFVWSTTCIVENDRGPSYNQEILSDEDYPTKEQDAHLIATAPELLEACKYVARYHRENDSGEGELFGLDFVTTCIAAIAKAEGHK